MALPELGSPFSGMREHLVPGFVAACTIGLLAMITADQIALLPPRPPTVQEVAASTPAAMAEWARVYPRLLDRLPPEQGRPPELGAVWATRSNQICGLVETVSTSVPSMEPFYTVRGTPHFRSESPWAYVDNWLGCAFDPWVMLHDGSYDTGFCATKSGRNSRLGAIKCRR